jgi:hypothetical protein
VFKLKAYYQNIDIKSTKELKTGQRINEKSVEEEHNKIKILSQKQIE